jgi:hypothetical protein
VDISAALAADLAVLSQGLDNPGVDLEAELRTFTADVKRAIASYTGMTMSIAFGGSTVSFSLHADATTKPTTSLLIPLAALTPTDAANTLLLYAATPGAFVDLAADLSYALGIETAALVLDSHLDPPADSAGVNGLDDHFAINQAIGVLIGAGHTPESARDHLQRIAASDHDDLRGAAETVIRNARSGPADTA